MKSPEEQLVDRVASAKTGRDLVHAMSEYYSAVDKRAAEFFAAAPRPVACVAGCAFCCHIPVTASAQEVLLLAAVIRDSFSADEQKSLLDRLSKHSELVRPLTGTQQHTINIPCPLLRDSTCAVYRVRPLACRAFHSLDVASCKLTYDVPTDLVTIRPTDERLSSAWLQAIDFACEAFVRRGYDRNIYELGTALLDALTSPNALRRFQQRKRAFPGAKLFNPPLHQ